MSARIRLVFCFVSLFFFALGASPLEGQIHGVPASVSSMGFGGSNSFTPGVAASVTSLGPHGFGGGRNRFAGCCFNAFGQGGHQSGDFFRRHRGHRNFFGGLPYTPVIVVPSDSYAYDDEDDSGGPTIFDRRGSRYVREREVAREESPVTQPAAMPPSPVVAQPSTVLVYRDGHQVELQNYAIVGDTIFDLTDNRSHRILLADIDVPATRKANDERGVDFQVPGQ
ncbi:MAG TPA: hypothetical protein VNW47_14140 [Terriglobales bacterium]|nr:hypothetical protein [Terriglobales bacterium]